MDHDIQKTIEAVRDLNRTTFNTSSANKRFEVLDRLIADKSKKQLAQALRWRSDGDSFDQRIFELISKAQVTTYNYYRLYMGFPDYVEIWEEWQAAPNEEDFFKKYEV